MASSTSRPPLAEGDIRHLREVNVILGLNRNGGLPNLRAKMKRAGGAAWAEHICLNPAVLSNSVACLQCLVDENKVRTVNMTDKPGGYTPLHMAIIWGRAEVMVFLLARGADPMLNTGTSVVDAARLRQSRLRTALAESVDGAEFEGCRIPNGEIRRCVEEGAEMLEVLEGVEAAGEYRAWVGANGNHPLVKRFSCGDHSSEDRYTCTVFRALVLAGRATLRSEEERAAVLAQAAAETAAQAREARPLAEALHELGFSERNAGVIADYWRQAPTLGQFRALGVTSEEIERKVESLVRQRSITEGEQRRLVRWARELREGTVETAPAKEKPKEKAAPKAKAKAQSAALLALAAPKAKAKAASAAKAAAPAGAPTGGKRKGIDGMGLLFAADLPDSAFMLIARYRFGRPPEPAATDC